MTSSDYQRLARRYAERAPTVRPLKLTVDEPLLSAAKWFGRPIHTPSHHEPLAIVQATDGRLFAMSDGDDGLTVVEVER